MNSEHLLSLLVVTKTMKASLHSPVVFKGASVNYTHRGNTFVISNHSFI